MVKTAIVILNWNGEKFLREFLPSVVEHSSSPSFRIYVADNASSDNSVSYIEKNFPPVHIIRLDKNHGFAGGYNLALKDIEAEYYILINSDIEVTASWAEKLTAFMDVHPQAAACQPRILSYSDRESFEYAGAAGGYIDRLGYPFCRGRIFHITEKEKGQYKNETEVFWASGACMIIRSSAWKRCGGFDGDFFAHMEEIDLCWRLHLAGYKLHYYPGVSVYHVGGGSLPYDSPFKTYLNFRNNLFMLYKNLPGGKIWITLFQRLVLDGVAAITFLLKGQPRSLGSVWKAHMHFYRALPSLKKKRDSIERTTPDNPLKLILNKSIVFEFYIRRRKSFSALKTNFGSE